MNDEAGYDQRPSWDENRRCKVALSWLTWTDKSADDVETRVVEERTKEPCRDGDEGKVIPRTKSSEDVCVEGE